MNCSLEEIKKSIYKLYRAAAGLNLYVNKSGADNNRIKNELLELKNSIDVIITTINQ